MDAPAARAQRAGSRTAYEGLGDSAAVDLLRREFSGQLRPLAPDAETLLAGDRVQEYLGDYAARVEGSDDRPARLIDSQVPLRVPASGASGVGGAAVDLDLVAESSGFAPDNGLVGLRLPDRVSEGIELGPVGVFPAGRAEVERVDSDTLAYPNLDTDTDLAVNATATGFETFHQLRGPDAPELQRLRLALPAGSSLRATKTGGAEVVRGGQVMLEIAAPSAVDAQGRSVPASYEIDGNVLGVRTPHRDGGFAFPILVDPEFTVKEDWACSESADCSTTWFHSKARALDGLRHWDTATSWSGVNWGLAQNCLIYGWFNNCYGPGNGGGPNWHVSSNPGWSVGKTGLHVWAGGGNRYPALHIGEFYYRPPGTTTRIFRADFGAKFLRRGSAATGDIIMFNGIWSYANGNWVPNAIHGFNGSEDGTNDRNLTHRWDAEFADGAPGPQAAAFGLVNAGGDVTPSDYVSAYMGAAIMQLTDPEPPAIGNIAMAGPTGWTREGSWTISPSATDPGLGMRRLRLVAPNRSGATQTQDRYVSCTGLKSAPCPASQQLPNASQPAFTVNAADLPEGPVNLSIKAADALGTGNDQSGRPHESTATRTVKIDRTAPNRDVAGSLRELENQWVRDGEYTVNVGATDGSAQQPRSGVHRIELSIDGKLVAPAVEQQCPTGSCSLSHSFSVDTSPLTYGAHTLAVTVSDYAGNVTTDEWTIKADARQTVFAFDPPVSVDEAQNTVPGVMGTLLTVGHSSPTEGGYELDGDPVVDALNRLLATLHG